MRLSSPMGCHETDDFAGNSEEQILTDISFFKTDFLLSEFCWWW